MNTPNRIWDVQVLAVQHGEQGEVSMDVQGSVQNSAGKQTYLISITGRKPGAGIQLVSRE